MFKYYFIKDVLAWTVIDIIFDCLFGIDLIISFMSAYYKENDKLIDNHRDIAINYLTGWFLIDFVAILPINYF
jgi:hypothetical protein